MTTATPLLAPGRLRGVTLALRVGIVLQAATVAWLAWRHGTSLNSFLFMELGTSEAAARGVDRALAAGALAAAAALCLRPLGTAAVVTALAFLVLAVADRAVGGRAFAELTPLAHATRWLAPLALVALWSGRARGTAPAPWRTTTALWILRLAVAVTFCVHGWECLRHHPGFLDLFLGAARRVTDSPPSEATARIVLTAIGSMDVLVALLILVVRWRGIAAWAMVWGFTTALSRTVALGPDFAHESVLRAMNGCAPLALWLLAGAVVASRRPSPPKPTP